VQEPEEKKYVRIYKNPEDVYWKVKYAIYIIYNRQFLLMKKRRFKMINIIPIKSRQIGNKHIFTEKQEELLKKLNL